MNERDLASTLISYDTSRPEGITSATGFIKGWLEARDFQVSQLSVKDLPVLVAETNAPDGVPTIVFHGHVDIVPGHADQYVARIEGDRLIGRGAYDMKAALAAMMCALHDLTDRRDVRVRFVCVPDEESEVMGERGTELVVQNGLGGDFAITGEPTDMYVGVQAKGVLALRMTVSGRAAHGSTPWQGDNAILKAIDAVRSVESQAFTRESSDLFDRPSINLGRISGGDAINKVPDCCEVDLDIRYLPGQDPLKIVAAVRSIDDVDVEVLFERGPAYVSRSDPYVTRLASCAGEYLSAGPVSVGRDGSSEASIFLDAGIPAVEFGPVGAGHHGPDEWVSLASLSDYRRALVGFVASVGEESSVRADGPGGNTQSEPR